LLNFFSAMSNFFRVLSGVQLIAKAQLKHYNKPKIYPTFQGKIYHNQFQKELQIETTKENKIEIIQTIPIIKENVNVEPQKNQTPNQETIHVEKNFQVPTIEPEEKEEKKEEVENKFNKIERKVPSNSMSRLMNFSRFNLHFNFKNQVWE
jgi:hypothetical protein